MSIWTENFRFYKQKEYLLLFFFVIAMILFFNRFHLISISLNGYNLPYLLDNATYLNDCSNSTLFTYCEIRHVDEHFLLGFFLPLVF